MVPAAPLERSPSRIPRHTARKKYDPPDLCFSTPFSAVEKADTCAKNPSPAARPAAGGGKGVADVHASPDASSSSASLTR